MPRVEFEPPTIGGDIDQWGAEINGILQILKDAVNGLPVTGLLFWNGTQWGTRSVDGTWVPGIPSYPVVALSPTDAAAPEPATADDSVWIYAR